MLAIIDWVQRMIDLAYTVRLKPVEILVAPEDWIAVKEEMFRTRREISTTPVSVPPGLLELLGLPLRPSDKVRRGKARLVVE